MAEPVDELPAFVATAAGAYGVIAGIASAASAADGVHTSVIRAAFGAFVVGGLGAAWGVIRRHGQGERLWFTASDDIRLATRAAIPGLLVVLAAAGVVVIVQFVRNMSRAGDIWAQLDPGRGGGIALALACVLAAPTLVLWTASALIGPGFMLGTDTSVDLTGSQLGNVPGFPLLAALPPPGEFPGWVFVLGLVPLLAGMVSGWRVELGVAGGTAGSRGARRRVPAGSPDSCSASSSGSPVGESVRGAWPTPDRRLSRRCCSRCPSWRWAARSARCSSTIVEAVPRSPRTPARLVVLVSGSGTNLQALIDSSTSPDYGAEIVAVGADRDGIEGLARAERHGIPTFVLTTSAYADRAAWDEALAETVAAYDPDLVVLAGFMKLTGPAFLARFGGRTLNTHPALSPAFPGMHGPRDALAYGVKVTGATLFVVDEGVDTGPIVAQVAVPVLDGDDEATLHERIKTSERAMLVEWVGTLAREDFHLDDRAVVLGSSTPRKMADD